MKGKWTAIEAGIGAGVDSYFEYLVKGATLLQRPELMRMFKIGKETIDQYLKKDDWHFWVNMKNGQVTMPLFQNLEAFWPGTLSMVGDISGAMKSLHNYHQVWKQYGFTPEFYNVAQGLRFASFCSLLTSLLCRWGGGQQRGISPAAGVDREHHVPLQSYRRPLAH